MLKSSYKHVAYVLQVTADFVTFVSDFSDLRYEQKHWKPPNIQYVEYLAKNQSDHKI